MWKFMKHPPTHTLIILLSYFPCINIPYVLSDSNYLPCEFPNSQTAMVFQSLHLSEGFRCPV